MNNWRVVIVTSIWKKRGVSWCSVDKLRRLELLLLRYDQRAFYDSIINALSLDRIVAHLRNYSRNGCCYWVKPNHQNRGSCCEVPRHEVAQYLNQPTTNHTYVIRIVIIIWLFQHIIIHLLFIHWYFTVIARITTNLRVTFNFLTFLCTNTYFVKFIIMYFL